jgi:hypothetical protein
MAYKPIEDVMENSKELVQIVHTLRQGVNVQGDSPLTMHEEQ